MENKNKKKICFYAREKESWYLDLIDFYSNDIKIFEELGHQVIKVHSYKLLPDDCDLYFVWWWSSGIVPLLKAKKWKKPVIMIGNIHYGDSSPQGYRQRPFYIKLFIKYCLKNSDLQLATSLIELNDIKKLKASNPKLLYHAIDSRKYKYAGTEGRKHFIFTITHLTKGNIERKKLREIILAFKIVLEKYPDYKLLIAGNTTDDGFPQIQNFVTKNGVKNNVVFSGRISEEEKIRCYQECMLYVQPTGYEGFGMAIAESMACGAPVVTSNRGAVYEVAGDSAVYVEPDDINDIANGIIRLLEDKHLSDKLNKDGSKRIYNLFSFSNRKKEIKKIIEEII